jgi:hypothetical protein
VMSKLVINVYFSCRGLYSRYSGSSIDYCYIEHLLFSCADCFKIVLSCTSLVDFMDLLKSSFAIFRMLYFMSFPYQIKLSFTYKKNIEWNFLCGPSLIYYKNNLLIFFNPVLCFFNDVSNLFIPGESCFTGF